MKPRDIRDLVHFADDGARTEVLIETERIWSEVVCLQGSQGLGPLVDHEADGVLTVLAGEVAVQVGTGRARMRQWASVIVPAGEALTMRNASPEPAVVLLVVAPPPSGVTASG
jgi:mannose-6-phosphate isomerase-like protein (cupin superfamily)